MPRLLFAALACGVLAGCNAGGGAPNANLPAMNVTFKWCSGSPDFTITGIPATAKTLNLRMIDQQAASFMHGGGSVPAAGKSTQTIPCGALNSTYVGPSPPPPQIHDYEWTVTAVDAGGQTVAVGRATRKFPE